MNPQSHVHMHTHTYTHGACIHTQNTQMHTKHMHTNTHTPRQSVSQAEKEILRKGEQLPEISFDSNCITPGGSGKATAKMGAGSFEQALLC
jgi:hypothetical protein